MCSHCELHAKSQVSFLFTSFSRSLKNTFLFTAFRLFSASEDISRILTSPSNCEKRSFYYVRFVLEYSKCPRGSGKMVTWLGAKFSYYLNRLYTHKKNILYRPFLDTRRKGIIEVVFTHGPIFNGAKVGAMVFTASNRCRGRALWTGSIHTFCCPWTFANKYTLKYCTLVTEMSAGWSSKTQTIGKTYLQIK